MKNLILSLTGAVLVLTIQGCQPLGTSSQSSLGNSDLQVLENSSIGLALTPPRRFADPVVNRRVKLHSIEFDRVQTDGYTIGIYLSPPPPPCPPGGNCTSLPPEPYPPREKRFNYRLDLSNLTVRDILTGELLLALDIWEASELNAILRGSALGVRAELHGRACPATVIGPEQAYAQLNTSESEYLVFQSECAKNLLRERTLEDSGLEEFLLKLSARTSETSDPVDQLALGRYQITSVKGLFYEFTGGFPPPPNYPRKAISVSIETKQLHLVITTPTSTQVETCTTSLSADEIALLQTNLVLARLGASTRTGPPVPDAGVAQLILRLGGVNDPVHTFDGIGSSSFGEVIIGEALQSQLGGWLSRDKNQFPSCSVSLP